MPTHETTSRRALGRKNPAGHLVRHGGWASAGGGVVELDRRLNEIERTRKLPTFFHLEHSAAEGVDAVALVASGDGPAAWGAF